MARAHAALLSVALVWLSSGTALAHEDDITVQRLGVTDTGAACTADGTTAVGACLPDNATYERLMLQLGTVVAPTALTPARTLGYRHFYVGFETGTTRISGMTAGDPNPDDPTWRAQNYFRLGMNGPVSTDFRNGNRSVPNTLTWLRLTFRKGLPLGFELGGSAGRLLQTSLYLFSFEVKWSLFEGFRRHWPAALPDLAVRAAVSSLVGTRSFTLTVPTFDVTLSKGIVLGHSFTLTPLVGAQLQWIIVDSGVVDLTPGNLADNPNGQSLAVFDSIRAWHPRVFAGLQLQVRHLLVNAGFRHDVGNPARGLDAIASSASPHMPKQWSVDMGLGVVY